MQERYILAILTSDKDDCVVIALHVLGNDRRMRKKCGHRALRKKELQPALGKP